MTSVQHGPDAEQGVSFGVSLAKTVSFFWAYAMISASVAVVSGELLAAALQRALPREPTAWTSTVLVGLFAAIAYDRATSLVELR